MATTALTIFLVSLGGFIVVAVVTSIEKRRSQRLFLDKARYSLDQVLLQMEQAIARAWSHFVRYVVQLGWYYSLHSLLRAALNLLVRIYEYIELRFENNRKKAKALRAEMRQKLSATKLEQVAEHKAAVALSPEEQEKLRTEKLEDTH